MAYDMKKYSKEVTVKVLKTIPLLLGILLVLEHYFVWGRLDFFDFFGHEWLGFVLILWSLYMMTNFKWKLKESPIKYMFPSHDRFWSGCFIFLNSSTVILTPLLIF